jgi:RimJ/RimL family protein N-acetyltransferase
MLRKPAMEVALYKLPPDDWQRVWVMYLSFEPKAQFQGLPPAQPDQLREWLHELQRTAADQFVVAVGERMVGHSMLCHGPRRGEAELAIFLHQKFRGRGLGRQLLLCTLNYGCKQLGLARVWLSVQGANPHALHLFESVGFRPVGDANPLALELEMERPLHCEKCKGDACAIFSEPPPQTVKVRPDKLSRSR